MDDLVKEETVQHLLEETEKAMRLYAAVKDQPTAADSIKRVIDGLFLDLGRTVYNLYWAEPGVPADQQLVELADFSAEEPTEQVRIPIENDLKGLPGFTDHFNGTSNEEKESWYTEEVERPATSLFGPEDDLKNELP